MPGIQTTEFWVSALAIVGAVLLTLSGVIPGQWGILASAISAGAYAVSRGLAKS
jgi:hypothetical protein